VNTNHSSLNQEVQPDQDLLSLAMTHALANVVDTEGKDSVRLKAQKANL
jgi:hypothetical protein